MVVISPVGEEHPLSWHATHLVFCNGDCIHAIKESFSDRTLLFLAAATTVAADRAVTNVNASRRGGTATSVAVGNKNAAGSAAGTYPNMLTYS